MAWVPGLALSSPHYVSLGKLLLSEPPKFPFSPNIHLKAVRIDLRLGQPLNAHRDDLGSFKRILMLRLHPRDSDTIGLR